MCCAYLIQSFHSTNSYFPLKNGQPCCRSKINSPHSGEIENLFFVLSKTIFSCKTKQVYFLIPFLHKSLQLSRHKDEEVLEK